MAQLGRIEQISYLVRGIRDACQQWIDTQGIGPWVIVRNLALTGSYDGIHTEPLLDVALAYNGDLQIELIEMRNEAPSPYLACFQSGQLGLHHVGYFEAQDIDGRVARAQNQGLRLRYDVRSLLGTRYVYLTPPEGVTQQAPVWVEIVETEQATRALFEHLRQTAQSWDGSEPIREIVL